MDGFLASFSPILKRLQKFKIEIILISLAFIISIISFVIFLKSNQPPDEESITYEDSEPAKPILSSKIVVDIAGAVSNPGVYEVKSKARIKDILQRAGGLSEEADQNYVSRNFNLARYLADQEKIYIPYKWEVQSGIFVENARTLDYTLPALPAEAQAQAGDLAASLININSATVEELDTLPGIGQVTAQKIIQNRPYKTIDELTTRKIVNKGVWEKIKELITN